MLTAFRIFLFLAALLNLYIGITMPLEVNLNMFASGFVAAVLYKEFR